MTIATAFGHLTQEQQNPQSTQTTTSDDYFFPTPETPYHKTSEMFIKLTSFQTTKKASGDLTGRFPYISSRGYQYFLVVYDYNSNAILIEVLKCCSGAEICTAYQKIVTRLAQQGCAPQLFILDNEILSELTTAFTNNNIKYQLVPQEVHCRNAAEHAIQTWKHHFIAGLSSVDPTFPMSEWD